MEHPLNLVVFLNKRTNCTKQYTIMSRCTLWANTSKTSWLISQQSAAWQACSQLVNRHTTHSIPAADLKRRQLNHKVWCSFSLHIRALCLVTENISKHRNLSFLWVKGKLWLPSSLAAAQGNREWKDSGALLPHSWI